MRITSLQFEQEMRLCLKSIFIMTFDPRTWITSTYGLVNTLVDTGCIVKIFQSTNINILYLLFDKAESTVLKDLNYVKS